MPKTIAPDIFRQRLLIEGYFERHVDEAALRAYLPGLAAHLGLRPYGEPVIFAPATGMGSAANAGFDAFMPLIDSGIAAYVWSGPKFLSVVIYSCAPFDEPAAVAHTREFFNIPADIVEHQF